MFTVEQVEKFLLSHKRAELWTPYFNIWLPKYDIETPRRIQDFMAQSAHESGMYSRLVEIASGRAYEGRHDLGNDYPGDGVKFKGRGPIQITGRLNYLAVSKFLFGDDRLVKNPELLQTPETGLRSALWYWKTRGLHLISDKPDDWTIPVTHKDGSVKIYTRFQYITLRINGGQNGIVEREALLKRAETIF